jgi:CRP/FNR family transcriptional regulator
MSHASNMLTSLYSSLHQVQPPLAELGAAGVPMQVPAGTVLFEEAAPCQGFPLVREGEIKVSRGSGDGRSLELYRVGASCVWCRRLAYFASSPCPPTA